MFFIVAIKNKKKEMKTHIILCFIHTDIGENTSSATSSELLSFSRTLLLTNFPPSFLRDPGNNSPTTITASFSTLGQIHLYTSPYMHQNDVSNWSLTLWNLDTCCLALQPQWLRPPFSSAQALLTTGNHYLWFAASCFSSYTQLGPLPTPQQCCP